MCKQVIRLHSSWQLHYQTVRNNEVRKILSPVYDLQKIHNHPAKKFIHPLQ